VRCSRRPRSFSASTATARPTWVSYEWAVAVVSDSDTQKFNRPHSRTLAEWCEYVRNKRDWDIGPHVGGSLVQGLAAGVDL